MPRVAWSGLLILMLAIPLASCFERTGTCPTCPPENSGRITVMLPQGGAADSLHVSLDGAANQTIRRGKSLTFAGLRPGAHSLTVVRWYFKSFVVSSRTGSVEVRLEPGELRVVNYHNDFPFVGDATDHRRAPAPLAAGPSPPRVG